METGRQTEIIQKKPSRSVRIFPFGMRSLPDLLKEIQDLSPGKKLPLFEVYMGQKTDTNEFTKNDIIPFGGRINEGESIEKAGLSRLNEKASLTVVPYSDPKTDEYAFEYKVDPDPSKPNIRVYFKSALVISPDILKAVCPQNDKDTELKIVPMTLAEFKESTKTGTFNDQKMAGVANYSPDNNDVIINEADELRRETYLKMIYLSIEQQEKQYADKLKERLILDASKNGLEVNGSQATLESVLMLINQQGNLDTVLKSSYERLIRESYMEYFREFEKKQFSKKEDVDDGKQESSNDILKNEIDLIKSRIVDGNFGIDLLHFLPLYTQSEMHPEAKTTRLINTSARFIRDSIKYCLPKVGMTDVTSFTEAKGLIENPDAPLSKKFEFFKKMDEQMLEMLTEKTGKTKRYITRAWFEAQKFIPAIGEMVKNVDPNLAHIYQFHELRNEVSNASMVQTIFLGLGIDTKKNNSHMTQIRFEALRQMAIFSRFLFESDVYERKSQKGVNPIDMAINNFFGPVETIEHKEFVDEKTKMRYEKPIERRRDSKGRIFIIDEKPTKPLESFIRKSFETKHTNILDLHSANVIVADDQYKDLSQQEKIGLVNGIADEFIQYLRDNFSEYKVSVSGDKNTFENFTSIKNGEEVKKDGKRTGSQGSRIVRRKMYVQMTKQNGEKADDYSYELVFYPFEKLATESEGEMLGWEEKLADDPNYVGKRLLESLISAYGLRSLYELLFPPSIYTELTKRMRNHRVLEK